MSSERPSRDADRGRRASRHSSSKTTRHATQSQPFDANGVRTMVIGTILWGIAIAALLPFWSTLRDNGQSWWLWTAMAGFGLGLLGIEYCRNRASTLAEEPSTNVTPKPKRPQLRAGSSSNTASDRLMQVARPSSPPSGLQSPDKESLGRKHHLLEQDSPASQPSRSEQAPTGDPASHSVIPTDRPVGRRRKPE